MSVVNNCRWSYADWCTTMLSPFRFHVLAELSSNLLRHGSKAVVYDRQNQSHVSFAVFVFCRQTEITATHQM